MGGSTPALGQVRQATALLQAAAQALDEGDPAGAVALAEGFAVAEKVAMAATRRALLCAGDHGARRHGGERGLAHLAARLTGTSLAKAKAGLRGAEQAQAVGEVARAYGRG